MPKLIISLVLILLVGCSSDDKQPAPKPSAKFLAKVQTMMSDAQAKHFPLLAGVEFELQGLRSPDVFFATDIKIPSLFSSQRDYVMYVNPGLENVPLDDKALYAILVHELAHFNDYQKMNIAELAWFYTQYLSSDEYGANYERATDMQAMELGYAEGIKGYRHWLYPQLTAEDLAVKQRNYYTPDEIDSWLEKTSRQTTGEYLRESL